VGHQTGRNQAFSEHGVTAVLPIVDHVSTLAEAMAQGPTNLAKMADRLARILTSRYATKKPQVLAEVTTTWG